MNYNRLFKNIWKCNAVLILIVGMLAIVQTVPSLYARMMNYKNTSNSESGVDIIEPDTLNNDETTRKYGSIINLSGSDFIIIPLLSDKIANSLSSVAEKFNYYSGPNVAEINLLFIDTLSREIHWLFADNSQLILNYSILSRTVDKQTSDVAILYTLVLKDSNGDKRMNDTDSKSIAISKPDGTQYTEIVSNVNALVDYRVVEPDSLFILYQSNKETKMTTLSLNDFKILSSIELPKI